MCACAFALSAESMHTWGASVEFAAACVAFFSRVLAFFLVSLLAATCLAARSSARAFEPSSIASIGEVVCTTSLATSGLPPQSCFEPARNCGDSTVAHRRALLADISWPKATIAISARVVLSVGCLTS